MESEADLSWKFVVSGDHRLCLEPLDYLLLRPIYSVAPSPVLGYGPGDALFVDRSTVLNGGDGLFSSIFFVPGDVITLYDGIVVPNLGLPHANTSEGASMTHACKIKGSEYTILGLRYTTKGRGLGSFANHNMNNNARLQTRNRYVRYYNAFACLQLSKCVLVEATSHISPGEEIFVRYDKHTLARLSISN